MASVAAPAFKLLRARRGQQACRAFASIGTGSGVDALCAIELFGADVIGVTDVFEEVVAVAASNIRNNIRPEHAWTEHAARFPSLTEPDDSYHGVIWTEVVKKWNAAPFVPRTRAHLLRDFGAAINPLAVFQLIQGVETLPLRIRRHNTNARRAAAYLAEHSKVAGIAAGHGALIAFDLPSAEAVRCFVDALWLFRVSKAYGDVRSAVVVPTTGNRVLLSIGLEHEDDILADLEQALAKAGPD